MKSCDEMLYEAIGVYNKEEMERDERIVSIERLSFEETKELPFFKMHIAFAKAYAAEAIKADRENVAKHAKVIQDYLPDDSPPYYYVDKNSIINCPSIELK